MRRWLLGVCGLYLLGCASVAAPPERRENIAPKAEASQESTGEEGGSEERRGALAELAVAPSSSVAENRRPTPSIEAAQKLECTEREGKYGCVARDGHPVIPFVYDEPVIFKRSGLALVVDFEQGYFYINATNDVVYEAVLYDNGPDEYRDGLARFQHNGKIGFLDSEYRVVIPAQYDAAYYFWKGKALVCVGCHPKKWSKSQPPGADRPGDEFMIDRTGKRLADPPQMPGFDED